MVSVMVMSQSAMRLSTISNAVTTYAVAAADVGGRDVRDVEVGAQHEGDLGLDPRCQQAQRVDRLVLRPDHVVEQDPEVGPVDAELCAHLRVRQPDLAPDTPGAAARAPADQGLLHLVGTIDLVLELATGEQLADRGARDAGGLSAVEALDGVGDAHRVALPSTAGTSKVAAAAMPVIHSGTGS